MTLVTVGIILIVSFGAAWIGTKIAIPVLKKANIQDIPNQRSSHVTPTPRGGGVGILFGVATGLTMAHLLDVPIPDRSILIATLLVASVGFLDDVTKKISVFWRLAVHLLAAGIVIYHGARLHELPFPHPFDLPLGAVGVVMSLIWIVGITNVYNFLDGIDGFAASQGLIAGLALALVASGGLLASCGLVIAGACAGFLLHNWHPAKVFMGDVGSTTLGFLFAVLPLKLKEGSQGVAVLVLMVALWFFMSDGVFTIIHRFVNGKKVWVAHRKHLYQILVRTGLRHDQVVLRVAVAAIGLTCLMIVSVRLASVSAQWSVLMLAVFGFLCYYFWTVKRIKETNFYSKRLHHLQNEPGEKSSMPKRAFLQRNVRRFRRVTSKLLSSLAKLRYIVRSRRRISFLFFDGIVCILSYCLSYVLRFEGEIPAAQMTLMITMIPFVVVIRSVCFVNFGLYQTLWLYVGIRELLAIIRAITISSILIPLVPFFLQFGYHPRSIFIIDWFLLIVTLGGSRVVFRWVAEKIRNPLVSSRKNVLIVGAGDTGELLVREFLRRRELGVQPVAFVDNDPKKMGLKIHDVKVAGRLSELAKIARVKKVREVIIALPEGSREDIIEVTQNCQKLGITCRITPEPTAMLSSQLLPLKLRPVDVSDLLRREMVRSDLEGIQDFFHNQKVLVTGAGGSIGAELVRAISQFHPLELILVDNTENNLYEIETDLRRQPIESSVYGYLRDVRNRDEMETIFVRHRPDVIYHAAAYKHVPMLEFHFREGVMNNVLGTKHVADLAVQYRASHFVYVSTDKAIRPKSLMGATKRVAELYMMSLKNEDVKMTAVRFGNVFSSRGSVVELFKKQLEKGFPLTITDPKVKRYFMDLSEAVFLILHATILGSDSEVCVLDMGKPVMIIDLARDLGRLMGIAPEDLPIKFIGLRPGEKLEEELELQGEKLVPTKYEKIKIWKSEVDEFGSVSEQVDELIKLVQNKAPREDVIQKVKEIVPEYVPWQPADEGVRSKSQVSLTAGL